MPTYNMQAWSLADLGNPAAMGVGTVFTVSASATPDIVTVNDGGTDDTPDDFNPVDSDQLVSGTVDGRTYTNALHEYELAYLVTDGTNTFVLVWVNTGASQNGNNQVVTPDGYFVVMDDPANPGQGALVAGTTYTILDKDISVNFANNGSFNAEPVYSDFVVCFATGTRIETATGPCPVERLRPGDLVRTRDHGLQPVRWIGGRTVEGTGKLAPVRIGAGALGPHDTVLVSPQHKVLVTGWRAELFFGKPEVLVAARHLVDGHRIRRAPRPMVGYWHVLLDQHEILWANGLAAESLLPAPYTLASLDEETRAELLAIFPDMAGMWGLGAWQTARPVLSRREAHMLVGAS